MAHLSLSLLGPFQATLDGNPVTEFESNKVRALFAYLAVESQQAHPRESVAGLLWPDRPDRDAFNDLRHTLAKLRQTIGDRQAAPPWLLITRNSLQFNRASDYEVDVEVFRRLAANSSDLINQLPRAIELYRGHFLEGFSIGDSPEFEGWALLKKEQHERQLLAALQQLATLHELAGNYLQAEPYTRRVLELTPWDEDTQCQLMRLLAHTDRRTAALEQFESCCQVLRAEFAVEPSPSTVSLYERIRDGIVVAPGRLASLLPALAVQRQTANASQSAKREEPNEVEGVTGPP
jgi:DNA-binding SARP family transcriptional activator